MGRGERIGKQGEKGGGWGLEVWREDKKARQEGWGEGEEREARERQDRGIEDLEQGRVGRG